jgi:hypothetical protein
VGVEGIEVLLAGSVEALGIRVHALLDRGVRNLLHQDANLHRGKLLVSCEPIARGGGF